MATCAGDMGLSLIVLAVICLVTLTNGFVLHMARGGRSGGGRRGVRGAGATDAGGATKKAFRDDPSAPGTRLNKVTVFSPSKTVTQNPGTITYQLSHGVLPCPSNPL